MGSARHIGSARQMNNSSVPCLAIRSQKSAAILTTTSDNNMISNFD